MSFCITAMGRSGTMFLAHALNQSPTWTVEHEPANKQLPLNEINARFRAGGPRYGEVNSYLRLQLMAIDVDYRAVIIREPMDIWQSMWNRGWDHLLGHLVDSLITLDALMAQGVDSFKFHDMTTDVAELQRIARACGIDDLPPITLEQANESEPREMPDEVREEARELTGWFTQKYFA